MPDPNDIQAPETLDAPDDALDPSLDDGPTEFGSGRRLVGSVFDDDAEIVGGDGMDTEPPEVEEPDDDDAEADDDEAPEEGDDAPDAEPDAPEGMSDEPGRARRRRQLADAGDLPPISRRQAQAGA